MRSSSLPGDGRLGNIDNGQTFCAINLFECSMQKYTFWVSIGAHESVNQ
jgi:hypothetical protein